MKLVATVILLATIIGTQSDDSSGNRLRPEIRFLQGLIQRINTLCDSSPPENCECDKDHSLRINPPLELNLLGFAQIVGCQPSYCQCGSRGGGEIDSRPIELRRLVGNCPRDQMESCECITGERVTFPFDLQTIFFECRPVKCKCQNEKADKPVTSFGCRSGGIPYCASKTDLWCEDNSVMVTREMVLHAKLDNECVCKDGKRPKCRSTGAFPKCPNGEEIDLSLGDPGVAFTSCSHTD